MTRRSSPTDELERLEAEHGWSLDARFTLRDGIWCPRTDATTLVSYPAEGHLAIAEVEDESYWFRHRNRAIARLALRRGFDGALWDVGAGTGVVAAHLRQCGLRVVAVEPGPDGARAASGRGLPTVICATLDQLGLPAKSISAVGLFDVIEHLEDPSDLLSTTSRVLRGGGTLLVSVPAYQWLWSRADEAAGHFRRYTLERLDREVLPHGFRRAGAEYLFHSLVLPVAIGRTLRSVLGQDRGEPLEATKSELRPDSPVVAAVLEAIFAFEDAMDRAYPLPFGTSALAAYERSS